MRNVGRSVGPIGTNSHAQSETSATTTGYIATVWCPYGTKALSVFNHLTAVIIRDPTIYPTLLSGWASRSRSAGARAEGRPLDATLACASNNLAH
jgi:hypothetical protein